MKIILADDHDMVRAGLRRLLDEHKKYTIVAEAKDGTELLLQLKKVDCNIVILDLGMPNLNGFESLSIIKKAYPEIKVIILTLFDKEEYLHEALKNNCDGYILKEDAFDKLIWALEEVSKGRNPISDKMKEHMIERQRKVYTKPAILNILSPRETEVLKHIALGEANKSIARILSISSRTVEKHRANINSKLEFTSVTQLIRFAIDNDLI